MKRMRAPDHLHPHEFAEEVTFRSDLEKCAPRDSLLLLTQTHDSRFTSPVRLSLSAPGVIAMQHLAQLPPAEVRQAIAGLSSSQMLDRSMRRLSRYSL